MDVGSWDDIGFDIEDCWGFLMRYKSLEVLSPLFSFGVIFFIAFRNFGAGCFSLIDVNYSVLALIVSIAIQLVNFRR